MPPSTRVEQRSGTPQSAETLACRGDCNQSGSRPRSPQRAAGCDCDIPTVLRSAPPSWADPEVPRAPASRSGCPASSQAAPGNSRAGTDTRRIARSACSRARLCSTRHLPLAERSPSPRRRDHSQARSPPTHPAERKAQTRLARPRAAPARLPHKLPFRSAASSVAHVKQAQPRQPTRFEQPFL